MGAWNRCDVCGQFIALNDFASGAARRALLEPSSDFGTEQWVTECTAHREPPKEKAPFGASSFHLLDISVDC